MRQGEGNLVASPKHDEHRGGKEETQAQTPSKEVANIGIDSVVHAPTLDIRIELRSGSLGV